jgi:YfiH family protein
MKFKLDILKPSIFNPDEIISGVTKRNIKQFPKTGFSITQGEILTPEQVIEHRKILSENLGVPFRNMKFQKQVHDDNIVIVDKYINNQVSDGMICNTTGIVINVSIADCCGILFCDPVRKVVAALHSGWKGTMKNIAKKCIALLHKQFNCQPENLLVFLSPSASGEKYEVRYDVAQYFSGEVIQISSDKFLFDNRKKILKQLLSEGVMKKNIEVSEICTISNLDYHSFRRDGSKGGRMSAFIGLK